MQDICSSGSAQSGQESLYRFIVPATDTYQLIAITTNKSIPKAERTEGQSTVNRYCIAFGLMEFYSTLVVKLCFYVLWSCSFRFECVTNERDESSFQCFIRDEGRSVIYALREEYINYFMVL